MMPHNNIFEGESICAHLVNVTYKRLMSRLWVTYTDIMKEYLSNANKKLNCNISNSNDYGELKKAFPKVRKAINEKLGGDNFEEEGNNRNRRIRYIGIDDDPLSDMRNAKAISDLKQYWQFCQDSAGFFPTAWLEYFFKDSRDLIDIKNKRRKGEQVLSASLDRKLTNIDLLPSLYVAIINKQVLSIDYKPFEEDDRTLIYHPHFLKEFNGRWFLFGYAEGQTPEYGYNIALDRIVNKPREIYNHDYISAPIGFYANFFKDIVGVSHTEDLKVKEVHVRAHTLYMYKLLETKRIHHSQEPIVPFGNHEDGDYGEFSIKVEVNNEFIGRILQMGDGLEVVSPPNVREEFAKRIKSMKDLYNH